MAYGDNQDVMDERRQRGSFQQSVQSPAPPVAYPGDTPGAPTSSAGAPSASGGGNPWGGAYQESWRSNPDYITNWVNQQAGGQGINPSVGRDPAYWTRRITETGGLGPENQDYWLGLMRRPEGAPEGGGMSSMERQLMTREPGMSNFPNLFGGVGASATGASGDLMKYLLGRGQGQISDASLPALNVSPNDPVIKAQTDAYRAEQDRGVRSLLSAEAEKMGTGANLGAETRSAYEKAAQSTAGYEGQLMQHELDSRRQEIQQALSGAMGFITAEQAMALQEELAQLDLAQRAFESDTSFQLRGMGL